MAYPISDVPRRIVYSGSAGVGPYAFTFEVLVNTDIAVYKNTTLLTLTTDYTVTINTGTGTGTVTLVVAATGADTVTIVGDRAIQRTSDFVTGGDLFANTLNDELDSQTIYVQQVDEKADRAIRSRVTDPTTLDMTLPAYGTRANKLLGFTAGGAPTVTTNTVAQIDAAVSSFVNATGNNAASILFDPAGTGAVTRTAQAKMRDMVSVKDFGAVGDGVTDDWQAVRNALDSDPKELYFPPGTYYLSKTLNLKRIVNLYGAGGFGAPASPGYPSILKFADGVVGIFVHRPDTNASDTGVPVILSPATTGADGSIIENLLIQRGTGSTTTPDGASHGIWLKSRALLRNVAVAGFAGNGIHIVADSGSAVPDNRGNANNWGIENARIVNNYHGIYVDLGDANAGCATKVDSSSNQGWGIFDSSFLGNTYVGCHTASNTLGAYKTDNTNAQNVFVGCYSETPQASEFVQPTTLIGGLMQRAYISGTYFSLDSLPAFTGVTSSLIKSQSSTGIIDAIAIETIHNSSSFTSSRHAGYRVRIGSVGGTETNVGMFYGRPSSSTTTDKHSAGIAVYNGTSGLYEKGIEAFGLLNQIIPGADNTWSMGSSSLRWSVVYAATGTINTSDEREKQDIAELDAAEKRVAVALKGLVKKFRFKDAVEKKGNAARIHVGVIAQEVIAAFQAEGLDPMRYAIVCYDQWPAEFDEDGNEIRPAGNRYGVRYEEMLAFIIAAL